MKSASMEISAKGKPVKICSTLEVKYSKNFTQSEINITTEFNG